MAICKVKQSKKLDEVSKIYELVTLHSQPQPNHPPTQPRATVLQSYCDDGKKNREGRAPPEMRANPK